MKILGISSFYHDSAAALVVDGCIVSAAQEERFTRIKNDESFPVNAIEYCLREAKISKEDLDYVIFYEKPLLKFDRLLENYLDFYPAFRSFSKAVSTWLGRKLWIKEEIRKFFPKNVDILFSEHHLSHGSSAFFPSPFESAVVITSDGVGEWATTSIGLGSDNQYEIKKTIHSPHSLGRLYSAFTYFCGFKVNSGEYKLMGLAPYGEPKYVDWILDHLIYLCPDGSYQLNMKYFSFMKSDTMTAKAFEKWVGYPKRDPEAPIRQVDFDLAASIQSVTESVMLRLVRAAHKEFGGENLCLAGGVALNCVSNGRIKREGPYKNIWIQPAAGDAGSSLGAALFGYHTLLGHPRVIASDGRDSMAGSYLGPKFSDEETRKVLDAHSIPYIEMSREHLTSFVAECLAHDQAVGSRALGNRSILASPLSEHMQSTLNQKIKFRESFRPFAPSVRLEDVSEYFEWAGVSPYMLMVSQVSDKYRLPLSEQDCRQKGLDRLKLKRSVYPGVTHVDQSARIQTVSQADNPIFHELLTKFKAISGIGVLVNTSFNVRGEPIVCTPEDAVRCFLNTGLDILVMNRLLLKKSSMKSVRLKTERMAPLTHD
ncbi:MAG: carbamoyltransferase [Bdellovibrionota bacterium]